MARTNKLCILAALVVSLSASQALAEDPVAPMPQHNPKNISQINGQLVEVGDHNRYDYSYKKYNLSTNPVAMIFGLTSLQGSVAISSMVALRGDLTVSTNEEFGKGVDIAASAAIYFRQMYSGLYVEPGLVYRSLQQEYYSDNNYSQESTRFETTVGVQTLIGYHWMWDSGLNAAISFGAGRNFVTREDQSGDEIFANGYVRFGYAF